MPSDPAGMLTPVPSLLSPPPSPPVLGPLSINADRPITPSTSTILPNTTQSIELSSHNGLLNRTSTSSSPINQVNPKISSPLDPVQHVLPSHTQPVVSDSPVLSNNASPSIALSALSLRTPQHRPLPLFLPPAPSTLTSATTRKPDFHTLRTSYTKMLGKKTASTMPPPPVPARAVSAASGDDMALDTRSAFSDDSMDLEQLLSQGEYAFRSCSIVIEAPGGGVSLGPVLPGIGDSGESRFPYSHLHRTATRCSLRAWLNDPKDGADCPGHLAYADSQASSSTAAALFGVAAPGIVGPVSSSGDASSFGDVEMDSLFNLLASPPPLQSLYQLPATPLSNYASSPFPDVLHTPLVYTNSGEFTPEIADGSNSTTTSPTFNLFEDFDANNQSFSLFADIAKMANSHVPLGANVNHPSLPSTIKPTELGLQLKTSLSRESSWEYPTSSIVQQQRESSIPTGDSLQGSISPPPSAGSRSKSSQPVPNGVRKNVTVHDLIPLDAPIQARNYITPSATSRKELPPSVAKTFVPHSRKRSASTAFTSPTDHDELADEDPLDAETEEVLKRRREMDPEKAALLEHVEQARRRNTMAARKSRQRKLEHVRGLEELVERLQGENEDLRRRLGERDDECEGLKTKVAELLLERGGG